jgi:hypothetical protein
MCYGFIVQIEDKQIDDMGIIETSYMKEDEHVIDACLGQ